MGGKLIYYFSLQWMEIERWSTGEKWSKLIVEYEGKWNL
jgi:hypothetical protein